jgi:hypothetical protein
MALDGDGERLGRRSPNARNLHSNFLARFNQHFLDKGEKVFDVILEQNPSLYFSSLVQLAKVMKIEVGEAGAFDARPRPRAEALEALEARARRICLKRLRKWARLTIGWRGCGCSARRTSSDIVSGRAWLRPSPSL